MAVLLAVALASLVVGIAIAIAVRNDRRARAVTRLENARQHQRAARADALVTEADGEALRNAWHYIVAMLEHGDLVSADDVDHVLAKLASSGFVSIAEEASIEIGFDGAGPDRVEVYHLAYTTPRASCSTPALLAALQRLATALRAFEADPPPAPSSPSPPLPAATLVARKP